MRNKKKQAQDGTMRRVFRNFRYTECGAFSDYLHEMSLKGWHFRKWQMGLVFEKGAPADITYCAEVFPKGSEMDLRPEKHAEEYADYCEAAGWELIDGQRKFCIFCRRDPDAPPIVTEEERFVNVRKAERGQLAWDMIVPVFLTAELWIRAMGREFADWIFFPPYLWILAILLETGAAALLVWAGLPKAGLALVCALLAVLTFNAVILWTRPSRDTNWLVQIAGGTGLCFLMIIVIAAAVFTENGTAENRKALEKLPLTQRDYRKMSGEPDYAEYVEQKSIFGSRMQGTVIWPDEEPESDVLSYDVYRSRYAWVLDRIWETKTDTARYRGARETDPLKALEVRSSPDGAAVCARYEDALLFFYADTPPAEDQTEMLLEKLDLWKDADGK